MQEDLVGVLSEEDDLSVVEVSEEVGLLAEAMEAVVPILLGAILMEVADHILVAQGIDRIQLRHQEVTRPVLDTEVY